MIDNYMLFRNLPTIDLHGNDRYQAVILAKEFICDNLKLKNKLIVIVHGKGEYILKNEVHKMLKSNHNVLAYKVNIFNAGETIVELKL